MWKQNSYYLQKEKENHHHCISTGLIIMDMQTVVLPVTAYTEQYFNAAAISSSKKWFQQYLSKNHTNMDGLFPKCVYKYLV